MVEILAPAGNEECALAAINAGANAVYLGYSAFSARDGADNFDEERLKNTLERAKLLGVKVYVAMNTLVKEEELSAFLDLLIKLWNMGVDAIIMQDVLLGKFVHTARPEICLHLSTQAGVCSVEGAIFAKECGFSRVILARETPLDEIEQIAKIIETEVFVQGALCTAFSGECYLSSFVGGNSGNRGRCKQPCRKKYSIDRKGYEEKAYALSLADLCVGGEVEKLIKAGVSSLKIEGRMRRAEYVAAAVKYYRSLLHGEGDKEKCLSNLKRAYNRGNYTKGLAFSQDKRFLSRDVQGHIGEKVGIVKVVSGKFLVESQFKPQKADAFKILRGGKEVGGAYPVGTWQKGFIISSKARLLNGDGVFITTDESAKNSLLSGENRRKLSLSIRFEENGYGEVLGGGVSLLTKEKLQTAKNAPLTKEEIENCFLKTDGLPIDVSFERVEVKGNIFLPKSLLNSFRREFYEKFLASLKEERREPSIEVKGVSFSGKNEKRAAIITTATLPKEADVVIVKKYEFSDEELACFKSNKKEIYLYFPAFTTRVEREKLAELIKTAAFDGVYAENYGGVVFARENSCKLFLGTGLNLSNSLSINELLKIENVAYYALSKELSEKEQALLSGEKAFTLAYGNLKVMELCYCPFEKTCSKCDKRKVYSLTDENGRVFPLLRSVRADGSCKFEVYNCAALIGSGVKNAGKLIELSLEEDVDGLTVMTEEEQKAYFKNYTQGHRYKSVT